MAEKENETPEPAKDGAWIEVAYVGSRHLSGRLVQHNRKMADHRATFAMQIIER